MAEGTKLVDAGGKEVAGYLNASAGQGKPAILVIQEWWGLNSQIRGVADRLAREGFITFAPDLYHGKLATDPAGAQKLMAELDWSRAEQDVRHAVQALRARDPQVKLGIIGFCMGGAVALRSAARIPELSACAPFYGIPQGVDLTQIRGRVQGHFANIDDHVTPDRVNQLEKTLQQGGVAVEVFRYDAHHAFFNEQRKDVHSPRDAEAAWGRVLQLFHATLG
jgi:carboxymethylenebutenolidase